MPLRFRCDECDETVKLPDSRRDRKNYCPRCDARLPSTPLAGNVGLWIGLVVAGFVLVSLAVVGVAAAWFVLEGADPAPAAQADGPAHADDDDDPVFIPPPFVPAQPGLPAEGPHPPPVEAPQFPQVDDLPPGPRAVPGGLEMVKQPPVAGKPWAPVAGGPMKTPPTPARLPIKPVQFTERKSYSLPEATERVIPAGGGRFLLLHFPKSRKLGVFDVNEGKLVRYIALAEDKPLFAGGMTAAVVYNPSAKVLQRYSLQTGEREATKVVNADDVKAIALGSASAGPLLMSAGDGGRLFDLETLTEMELPAEAKLDRFRENGPLRLPISDGRLWAAASGRLFVGAGHYGVATVAMDGNRVKVIMGGRENSAYALPSADGKYVFRSGSGAVAPDGQKTSDVVQPDAAAGFGGYYLLPALDGPFYFRLHSGAGMRAHDPRFQKEPDRAVSVYIYGLDAPIARVLDLKEVPEWEEVHRVNFPLEERLHLIPRAKLLVGVAPARDRLTLVPLDLDRALDETRADFLVVTSSPPGTFCPGKMFRYLVRARSKAGGVKYTLEAGPDGMKVAPEGMVSWQVPAAFDDNDVSVILGVKDASGKEAFHHFRLTKSDRVEQYAPDPEPEAVKVAAKPGAKPAGPRIPFRLPEAPRAADILPPPAIAARTEVRLPDRFDAVVSGGDGQFLVFHARAAKRAFVFDASAGAVARTIDVGEENSVLAAGMTQLLVYRRSSNTIEKFNLQTGASEGKKSIPTRDVTEMVMGSGSAGPLFVRAGNAAELYDVESLTPMATPEADGLPFTQGPVWASADGRVFGNVVNRASGPLVRVAVLSADSVRVTSELGVAPYAVPGPDGKLIYAGGYGELTDRLQPSNPFGRPIAGPSDEAWQLLPVPGGVYFAIVHLGVPSPAQFPPQKPVTNGVTIYRRDRQTAVATLDAMPEMTPELDRQVGLPSALHVVPTANLVMTVPASKDRVVLYPAHLDGAAYPVRRATAWRVPDAPAAAPMKPGIVKERTTIALPGRVTKAAAGGAGRYLVFQFDPRKLVVFDVGQAKVTHEITTKLDIVGFAAGMHKLVLYEKGDGSVLRRYDLATGKLEASAGAPPDSRHAVVMGSASAGPVLVAGWDTLTFFDLETLSPMKVPGNSLDGHRLNDQQIAASADGKTFVAVEATGPHPNHPVVLKLDKDGLKLHPGPAVATYTVGTSADGQHIFLGTQGVFTDEFKAAKDVVWSPEPIPQVGSSSLIFAPAADGPYYLHLHTGIRAKDERFAGDPQYGVSVYKYGNPKAMGHVPGIVGRTRPSPDWYRLQPAGPYQLFASARLLVAVELTMNGLVLLPLDPENIPPAVEPEPVPPKESVRPKGNVPKVDAGPRPAVGPVRLPPLPESLPITPVTEARTFTFPDAARLSPPVIRFAGGGRFVLVQRSGQVVEVFDLNEGKVVRQIEFPAFCTQWAAGLTKLFMYHQEANTLRRFDLLTGKEDAQKVFNTPTYPVAIGSASVGPVLTVQGLRPRFIDGETLELMTVGGPELAGPEYANRGFHASADGRSFGVAVGRNALGAPPGRFEPTITLALTPDGVRRSVGEFPSLYAIPDPSGRYVFAGGHGVYDSALKKTPDAVRSEDPSPRAPPEHVYLPAEDGPFYLRHHITRYFPPGAPGLTDTGTGVSIFAYGKQKPIVELKDVDPLANRPHPLFLRHSEELMKLVPRAKALIVVSPGREFTIHVIPVDLQAEMARSGVEVPWVTSDPPRTFKAGAEVRYPLKVLSKAGGLQYSLDDAKPGMAVSAAGVLSWKAPADAQLEVRVAVCVKDAKGGESVHSFLMVRN